MVMGVEGINLTINGGVRMLKMNESQAREFIAELAMKCDMRWKETVDKTRFMNDLREGKVKNETLKLF